MLVQNRVIPGSMIKALRFEISEIITCSSLPIATLQFCVEVSINNK